MSENLNRSISNFSGGTSGSTSEVLRYLFQHFFLEKQHHLQAKKECIPICLIWKDLEIASQTLHGFCVFLILYMSIQNFLLDCTNLFFFFKEVYFLILDSPRFQNSLSIWAQNKIKIAKMEI